MNDATQKVEDRFHNPLKVSYGNPPKPQFTKNLKMAFCPQGKQLLEAKQGGYQFSEDKEYEVLERKDYKIKVVDDSGKERWVKEDYFTLAHQALMHDKDCGFTTKKVQETLKWNNLELDPAVPDVRKVKFDNGIDDQLIESCQAMNTKALAGVDGYSYHHYQRKQDPVVPVLTEKEMREKKLLGPNQEFIALSSPATKEELFAQKRAACDEVAKPCDPARIPVVKENPLLNDIDKLWEKMGNVFPEYKKVDSDGLMDYIKARLPGRRLEWKCGVLTVDGATTNINKGDVNVAFDGLKKLATPKMADKLIGKIIVSKLKKLF